MGNPRWFYFPLRQMLCIFLLYKNLTQQMAQQYTVKSGDTLGKIAAKFYGASSYWSQLAEANGLPNPNDIRVGQVLTIPDLGGTTKPQPEPATTTPPPVAAGSMLVTKAQLQATMPKASSANVDKFLPALNSNLATYGINTPLRIAHFLAQIGHESASLSATSENLNYSAKGLRAVFGKYFPTDAEAQAFERQPEKIANRVYANRMGNGNEASGDGYRYRGRGLIQLTGKDNYTQCGNAIKLDLVGNPDQLASDANAAVDAAGWFWDSRKLNTYADADDIKAITKRINGGYNGLEDRQSYLTRAKQALGIS